MVSREPVFWAVSVPIFEEDEDHQFGPWDGVIGYARHYANRMIRDAQVTVPEGEPEILETDHPEVKLARWQWYA